eukprot:TRINITY_DN90007_c0_g1_i1.p1 TRINITY_DN90007_c0_g1~~TRINITY_DN90007_c0_g1_i1.p1  ORF type:complete len:169 (-),score=23.30 TRINITY_DN90007_c0_g1_i1:121-627(-)
MPPIILRAMYFARFFHIFQVLPLRITAISSDDRWLSESRGRKDVSGPMLLRREMPVSLHVLPDDEFCEWTDWSDWTLCTHRCGGGNRTRMREETIQANDENLQCDEPNMEMHTVPCNEQDCDTSTTTVATVTFTVDPYVTLTTTQEDAESVLGGLASSAVDVAESTFR